MHRSSPAVRRTPAPSVRHVAVLACVALAACGTPERTSERGALTAAGVADPLEGAPTAASSRYPVARRGEVVDDYQGTRVADPYRWLEDSDAPETRAWIDAQNELSSAWLGEVPARGRIRERLTVLWNYERLSPPEQRGERWFWFKNDGLQNQSVLFVGDAPDAEGSVLLDPNTLSQDGTVSLAGWSVSEDGRWLAYGLSDGGSDWSRWHVRSVDDGADLPDVLEWVKFSGAAWTHDNAGFFYSRYPEPKEELQDANYDHALWYHRRGTSQSADELVYARPDEPEWGFGAGVTDDGELCVLHVWHGTERKNRVYCRALPESGPGSGEFTRLFDDFDADYTLIDKRGGTLYLETDLDAPLGRVVAVDLESGAQSLRTVVPEATDALQQVTLVGGKLLCRYLEDARTSVKTYALDGSFAGRLELPGLGTATGFDGRADDTEAFYTYTSYTEPASVYRLDVASGSSSTLFAPDVDFDPSRYVTRQVFYRSKDGTRVPMFLTYRRGMAKDGRTPTLLYGYGGFDISLTPAFSVARAVWLELGGVYAVANLRGGGEYGREWHEAGIHDRKQNVFDDFIAAAEWLIDEGYTSSDRLAIQGRSNGGLLVGACLTQRPDLFGAALPGVGVLDMLRYHKFTIGWAWASDYGTSDDSEGFRTLRAYSPLHNVRPGTRYPPTLVTTGDHDDRVVPLHSFKFAAALQAAQEGPDPILARIETRAGHGSGKPVSMQIDEVTDELAFLVRALAITPPPAQDTGPAASQAR